MGRTTLPHLPQIHPQIQNTKYKIQSMPDYPHLPQIHPQIQNTKHKIQIQNTKYARLPAQHYCTFHKYIHKYKYKTQNTITKYDVCPITRTTLLHLPQIQNTKQNIQIRNTMYARLPAQHYCTFHKYKIQNTKYKYVIRCMPDYPQNITAPSTNTSTNIKHKIQI